MLTLSDVRRGSIALLFAAALAPASALAAPARSNEATQPTLCADDYPSLADLLSWSGVKAITDSLNPATMADAARPISLSSGLNRSVHVQWTSVDGRARLSELSVSGSDRGTVLSFSGSASRGGATLRTDCNTAVPTLATEHYLTATAAHPAYYQVEVKHLLGYSDYGSGSEQAVVTRVAADRAVLVGKVAPLDFSAGTFAPPQLFVALIQPSSSGITYTAPPLVGTDGYWKGRRLGAPGDAFSVRTAAPRPGGGVLIGGNYGSGFLSRDVYVYALDSTYEVERVGTFSMGILPSVASVLEDSDGQVVVCGSFLSPSFGTRVFVVKFDPDFSSSVSTTFTIGSGPIVGGCTLSSSGQAIMSGSFTGAYGGGTAAGRDLFLAALDINAPGVPVSMSRFQAHGTAQDELAVSTPLADWAGVYVAGITRGTWGEATGAASAKLFVLKARSDTLALY